MANKPPAPDCRTESPAELPPAILLMGPTASGKTALAFEIADRFPVTLISVDSAQVFRDMDIGTAKPDTATLARYPHRLIDLITPEERYSAARFREDALQEMAASTAADRVPLLVGGTMLYYKALRQGLADLPEADPALRASLDRQAAEHGWPALHAQLAQLDPATAARLAPSDAQRIQRALEVVHLTGRPLGESYAAQAAAPLPYRLLPLALLPSERSVLHQRIAARFDEMLAYVDRCDSGDLRPEEVAKPSGWILLSFLMDPRTGLGRYRDYRISNYQLMMRLVDLCRTESVETILADPDVAERVKRYFEQEEQFAGMLRERSWLIGKTLLIDLREQEEIFTGNRFTAYALFPDAEVSVQVIWGKARQNVVLTVGKSIFDRTNPVDIGRLMLSYGGGGHRNVGTCQVPEAQAERVISDVIAVLNGDVAMDA